MDDNPDLCDRFCWGRMRCVNCGLFDSILNGLIEFEQSLRREKFWNADMTMPEAQILPNQPPDYNITIPLMITVAVSHAVRTSFSPESIYTLKVARRGHFRSQTLKAWPSDVEPQTKS